MKTADFRHEYFCEPAPLSVEERRAIELWCWYSVTCKSEDAHLIRNTVALAGRREGIPRQAMIRGAKVAGRMPLAEQERLAVGPRLA